MSSSDSSEGTPTTATSTTSGMRRERLLDLGRRHVLAAPPDHLLLAAEEGVGAVVVLAHEVAGLQPAVVRQHRRGLLRHPPVALHHRGVAQLELAVRVHARLVHLAERRMLARHAERPVRARAVRPDRAVGGLGHRVAGHQPEPEAALELEVAVLGRSRPGVREPHRVVRVVGALGLAHQDLEHRADRVELRWRRSGARSRRSALAEKRGRSTRLARAATEPSTE